jgi:hypothetical protein
MVFVHWHQPTSSGAIRGTITFANLAGKPPAETVTVESTPFTGQLSPGASGPDYYPSISLTVSGQDFGSGTFQNGKLVLNVPNDGDLRGSTYVLVRCGSASYGAALQKLTAQKQRANKMAVAHS